eukprot:scaffold738_cov340-Pavlova_lutheri.AAC.17
MPDFEPNPDPAPVAIGDRWVSRGPEAEERRGKDGGWQQGSERMENASGASALSCVTPRPESRKCGRA